MSYSGNRGVVDELSTRHKRRNHQANASGYEGMGLQNKQSKRSNAIGWSAPVSVW